MALWPLTTEILVTFLLSSCLLYRYGNWNKHNPVTTISVFVAWFFSFIVIFLIPLDISNTSYLQCVQDNNHSYHPINIDFYNYHHNHRRMIHGVHQNGANDSVEDQVTTMSSLVTTESTKTTTLEPLPNITVVPFPIDDHCVKPYSFVPRRVLISLWRVVYWTSQILTWIVLPVMQTYSMAGDFTPMMKMRSALWENIVLYGLGLIVFFILFIYVAVHYDSNTGFFSYFLGICISIANTWGLLLLVILLGYGLVEIPRSCFEASRLTRTLNYIYFKVAKLSTEKIEEEERLEDALEQIHHTYSAVVTTHQHLRPMMDVIVEKTPPEWRSHLLRQTNHSGGARGAHQVAYNENDLVRLHKNILRASQAHHRTQVQWQHLIDQAIEWEDVSKNMVNVTKTFKRSFARIPGSSPLLESIRSVVYPPSVEWMWKCVLRSPTYKVLGVIISLFSLIVIWSEFTFGFSSAKLSIFNLVYELSKREESYFVVEMVTAVSIGYFCICSYYTVFKIRVFNYYYLAPHHQTDEYSLIFCGMMLCRLTPPLCLNFLSLLHLDSHLTQNETQVQTAFTTIMGHMDVIPILSSGFNTYLPIVMGIFALATFMEVGSRFLHYMGIEQFIPNDEMTGDLIQDGSDLVKREKIKKARRVDGGTTRSGIRSFPVASSSGVLDGENDSINGSRFSSIDSSRGDPERGGGNGGILTFNATRETSRTELLHPDQDNVDYSTINSETQPNRPNVPQRDLFDDI